MEREKGGLYDLNFYPAEVWDYAENFFYIRFSITHSMSSHECAVPPLVFPQGNYIL